MYKKQVATTHYHPFQWIQLVPIKAVLGTESLFYQTSAFISSNVGIWQFKHHCMTNITMNIIKIEEKDTFHNVIGYKQKPSVSFLVRILVENFVTQK